MPHPGDTYAWRRLEPLFLFLSHCFMLREKEKLGQSFLELLFYLGDLIKTPAREKEHLLYNCVLHNSSTEIKF